MNGMRFSIRLLFHGSLNAFLPKRYREQTIERILPFFSTIKDTVEAIGVPHVEIEKILVNQLDAEFDYRPQQNDWVEVFPYGNTMPTGAPKSFVLDVHLGALARLLRMMGIDAVYRNDCTDKEIVAIAVSENRAVLTKDVGLLKHKQLHWGYWLRSQQAEEQFREVAKRFALCAIINPFSRCIACNGIIKEVEKSNVANLLPKNTERYFTEFYRCGQCGKLYWKGSHFEAMQKTVERLKSIACQ